jgi:hypothetical protein
VKSKGGDQRKRSEKEKGGEERGGGKGLNSMIN